MAVSLHVFTHSMICMSKLYVWVADGPFFGLEYEEIFFSALLGSFDNVSFWLIFPKNSFYTVFVNDENYVNDILLDGFIFS